MTHWNHHTLHWAQVRPPLRPAPTVVDCLTRLVADPGARVLILGVTVELVHAFDRVLAVDKNAAVIAAQWPEDVPGKVVRCSDWLTLTDCDGVFDAVVGDGMLTALDPPDAAPRLFRAALDALKPGGRFACRLFERPERAFTADSIGRAPDPSTPFNFHALKWQIAMMLAGERGPQVPVASILAAFEEIFPDRDELAQARGWSRQEIDTIDVYRDSPLTYLFPNRAEHRAWLPPEATEVQFVDCGGYPLAECCPILTFRKACAR